MKPPEKKFIAGIGLRENIEPLLCLQGNRLSRRAMDFEHEIAHGHEKAFGFKHGLRVFGQSFRNSPPVAQIRILEVKVCAASDTAVTR